jgi:tetratricopeptide (TPR) repeat protein
MPSHIFIRLGLWEESIQSNLNSTSSARCYAENTNIKGHWDEELHGMDYLVYAYLQLGDNKLAEEQLTYLNTFETTFPENFKVAYANAAIPARIALENKNWSRAANVQLPSFDFPWDKFPWQKAIIHYTRAMGSARLGDIESAEKELAILTSLHGKLVADKDDYKSNQVDIQIKTAEAWIQFARNDYTMAIALMEQAATMEDGTGKHPVTPGEVLPARELLADLFLATGEPAKALEAYEAVLKKQPNRFNGIYGAAVAAGQTRNREKAAMYFGKLLELTKSSGSDRPELLKAREFLNEL